MNKILLSIIENKLNHEITQIEGTLSKIKKQIYNKTNLSMRHDNKNRKTFG